MAANGVIVAPMVALARFHCVGKTIEGFPVVAHTLPSGTYVDGLLGMDFLNQVGAVLDLGAATLRRGG
jgi:predicted aspartyl protease